MTKTIAVVVLAAALFGAASSRADSLDDQWAICRRYLNQQTVGGIISRSTDLNAGRWTSSDVLARCEPVYQAITTRAAGAAAASAARIAADMAALKALQATPSPTPSTTP